MPRKHHPKIYSHTALSDTGNAVETSIDLSREMKNISWEQRIEKLKTPIKHWVEKVPASEENLQHLEDFDETLKRAVPSAMPHQT